MYIFVASVRCQFFFSFILIPHLFSFFFFNDTAPPEISPFSLPDALPICRPMLAPMRPKPIMPNCIPSSPLFRRQASGVRRQSRRQSVTCRLWPVDRVMLSDPDAADSAEIGRAHV